VRLPEKTNAFAFSIVAGSNLGQVVFEALGAKKLPLSFKQKVRTGGTQVVKVRGLAAKEKVKVVVGGVTKRGTATIAGQFARSFKVGRKVGKVGVRVVGQFSDRKANRAFRVVR